MTLSEPRKLDYLDYHGVPYSSNWVYIHNQRMAAGLMGQGTWVGRWRLLRGRRVWLRGVAGVAAAAGGWWRVRRLLLHKIVEDRRQLSIEFQSFQYQEWSEIDLETDIWWIFSRYNNKELEEFSNTKPVEAGRPASAPLPASRTLVAARRTWWCRFVWGPNRMNKVI